MNDYYEFINLPLPYGYNALEPYIDEKTMQIHHDRHLQTYIDNLNSTLKTCPMLQKLSLTQLICNAYKFPKNVQTPIRNNAGGVYNHRFYFDCLANLENKMPYGKLAKAIDSSYGSFENFKKAFKVCALSVFGSGYAWLTVTKNKNLKFFISSNQCTPLTYNLSPVLTIDVWEHAYYLKHYNKRGDYIDDWFNVVNWEKANENYLNCFEK